MNFKMMQNKIMFNQHEVINGMMNVLGLLPAYSAGSMSGKLTGI
jgi:hypothetical protein